MRTPALAGACLSGLLAFSIRAGTGLTAVDDTGHTIPIEQPDRWREQLLAFLPA